MTKPEIPVGIDLGTTFSAVAYLDAAGRPCTITNSEGELTTPTVVFFDRDGIVIGTEASLAGESEPGRLAKLAKRDMGGERYSKRILNRHLPPEVIQSLVLERIKADAELRLGKFSKAVITVPAYFNEPRRKATQDAGQLAGIDVIDIINEPTAAALAYGIQQGFLSESGVAKQKETVLVYDLGGGTFDVTLMEIDETDFTTIATAGDVYLGGVDWDRRVFDYAAKQIQAQHGFDVSSNETMSEKLIQQCTRAKKTLSARNETVVRVEHDGQRFKVDLTREKFEELTMDLLERTRLTTDRLLRDSNHTWNMLTKLILVGGSTRMPMVQEMLERESGLEVDRSLSPDESIAHGAAIYAGILLKHGASAGKGISVKNVNSHDLGVLGVDPKTRERRRQIVIKRNHRLPAKSSKQFVTAKENQKKIVVKIVEGGTDTGQGATSIGQCVVENLPDEIAKGTPVVVTFKYLSSGRLQVLAEIPSLNITAASSIDRAHGMSELEIKKWRKEIARGLEFSGAPELPPAEPDLQKSAKPTQPIEARQKVAKKVDQAAKKKSVEKPVNPKNKKAGIPNLKKAEDDGGQSEIRIQVENEQPKSAVGSSQLGFLNDPAKKSAGESIIGAIETDESKKSAGDSILDFLNTTADDQKSSNSDSALGEFLKDLE